MAQQAHHARWVVGVRGLATGVARDVSGVLRVGRGGGWDDDYEEEEEEEEEDNADDDAVSNGLERGGSRAEMEMGKEMEVLYLVQPDGGVKVFERGGGSVG